MLRCVASLAVLLLIGSCVRGQSTPESQGGKRRIVLVTEYDDTRAGAEASQDIAAEMGFIDDAELQSYLRRVGERLVPYAPERPFDYKFQAVDQREPNAFALPGGYIYVSRGALALANSEDELANVLGHEITHSAERHAAARNQITLRQSPLLMPLLRFARIASYSRDQERAADRGGQRMAAEAGYDPAGMAHFLDQLRDVERMTFSVNRMPTFLSTHPGTSERVTDCSVRARSIEFQRRPETTEVRRTYLESIDGLLLGENPAEGVFEDTTFIHPDLGFRIRFPEDWSLENGRAAVGARSPDGEASIFLTVEPTDPRDGLDPEAAARLFLARSAGQYQADPRHSKHLQLGPLPAYRIDGRGIVDGRNVGAQLTFVPLGGLMYRITAVAPIRVSREYMGRARVTARSFRALTPTERHSVVEERLALAEAIRGETLADLSSRTDNAWDDQRIAILNGLPAGHVFEGGELVKIAIAKPYLPDSSDPVDPAERDAPEPEDAARAAEGPAGG